MNGGLEPLVILIGRARIKKQLHDVPLGAPLTSYSRNMPNPRDRATGHYEGEEWGRSDITRDGQPGVLLTGTHSSK
jgi:hypothetical protein